MLPIGIVVPKWLRRLALTGGVIYFLDRRQNTIQLDKLTLDSEQFSGHRLGITSMATNTAGSVLVTGDGAGIVRVWDFRSGRRMAECDCGC